MQKGLWTIYNIAKQVSLVRTEARQTKGWIVAGIRAHKNSASSKKTVKKTATKKVVAKKAAVKKAEKEEAIKEASFEPQLRNQQYDFISLPKQIEEQIINY